MNFKNSRLLMAGTSALVCSIFDPDAFMSQSVEAQLDTQRKLPPVGDYRAIVDDWGPAEKAFRTFTSDKNQKDYTVFSPPFILQDDNVAKELDVEKVVVYHKGMFIDINDLGGLDTGSGKNVDLGKMRDAVGQNNGSAWTFNNLKGAGPVMVHVEHEQDKNDKERSYARVTRVVKIG